ncbi:MAG: pseudouridine synthase [Butyricicoccaceae bacterium]
MPLERIDKLLTGAGLCSRRDAVRAVKAGLVTLDGEICRDAAKKVDPQTCRLTWKGEPVQTGRIYLMLNKPAGVLSARQDAEQRTVLDLFPERFLHMGLFPVGRLDKDTVGLLLLTTDGVFAHGLTSPRRHVDKVYRAEAEGVLTEADVDAFAEGLTLRDGTKCRPAKLEILHTDGELSTVLVTVQEGKYHQVRRMLASRGAPVRTLERLSVGAVRLDPQLERGQWRELTKQEIEALSGL